VIDSYVGRLTIGGIVGCGKLSMIELMDGTEAMVVGWFVIG
jgi:hypothetical protein